MWYEGFVSGKKKKKKKYKPFQTKWHRAPGGQAYRASRSTSPRMSGIQVQSGWNMVNLSTPGCREQQTVFQDEEMGSSRALKVALCAMMPALPKPPPIPRVCPHSQSKIITLYYRLQTGPVNILPLSCHQRRNAPERALVTTDFASTLPTSRDRPTENVASTGPPERIASRHRGSQPQGVASRRHFNEFGRGAALLPRPIAT